MSMRFAAAALLCAMALGAQSADQVAERARQLYGTEGPRTALPEYERALALYRQEGNRRGEAVVLGQIGNCYKHFGEFPKALDYLGRALALKQQLGDRREEGRTLNHLGLAYWEMGEFPTAVDFASRAAAVAGEVQDRQLEAAALNTLALASDELGEFTRSLDHYRRALEIFRATGHGVGESATLGNIGGVYLLLGRYREARDHYQQALGIAERLNSKSSATHKLGNLALCELGLGRIVEALALFDRALLLAREAGLKKEEADWQRGKAGGLMRWGQYTPALDAYRESVAVYEQAGHRREFIEAVQDLGTIYALLGDLASAEAEFRRALDQARAIQHPRGVIQSLILLGDLEWRRRRYAEAATLYQQAHQQARDAGDQGHAASALVQLALTFRDLTRWQDALDAAQQALEIARAAGARLLEAQALYALGEVARGRGLFEEALAHFTASSQIAAEAGETELGWRLAFARGQALEALRRFPEALAGYQQAAAIIESVRSQLRAERFRAGYVEDKQQVYVALVRLLLEMGQPAEAFLFAEKLRARSYSELLAQGRPAEGGEALVELREKIRQLQRALEKENVSPAKLRRAAALSAEAAAAERAYHNLLDDLRSRGRQYDGRLLAPPSVVEVQRRLPGDTALVEYIVGPDRLAIFVLTSAGLRATTVPLRANDLRARVELLRDLIQRPDSSDWRKPAAGLRAALVDPIEQAGWLKGIVRLYLVPHGILHYLPFAALARPAGNRFLIDDYTVAYLPAAAALLEPSRGGNVSGALFAAAPARSRLTYAQEEARSIRQYFSPKSLVLAGSRATESAFKREAARYGVLHLATHGRFNKMNPLLSAIELEPGQQEDGRLEVHEILGLRLSAGLVTLSACETALGSGYFAELPAGEDFVGLTRAFLHAGSPSVLATLWEVNDRSTLGFMRAFYRRLQRSDKAEALAEAQRGMRRQPGRNRHPYFWAPFVLVGAMQ